MKTPLSNLLFSEQGGLFVGESDWFIITPDRMRKFDAAIGGGERADGVSTSPDLLVLSLIPGMLAQLVEIPEDATIVNYGLDRVHSRGLPLVGDSVRGRFELRSRLRVQPGQVLLRFHVAFEARSSGQPALVVDPLIAMAHFTPAAGAASVEAMS